MTVLGGGGAVSYERGTPVGDLRASIGQVMSLGVLTCLSIFGSACVWRLALHGLSLYKRGLRIGCAAPASRASRASSLPFSRL